MGFFSSVVSSVKKVGRAIGGAIGQIGGIISTIFHRSLGIIDFGLGLIGIRPKKKLHLRVVILKDESVTPLTTPNKVLPNIDFAKSIFKQQANIEIIAVDDQFIEVYDYAAPTAALDVSCDFDAWIEDFGEAGNFFRMRSATIFLRSQTGYGSPVSAFIVRDVKNKQGCALGPLFTNYITVDTDGLEGPIPTDDDVIPSVIPSKLLAHEIAHACGLSHRDGGTTLMNPDPTTGTRLTRFQKAWLRNSRHVTYL